MSENEVSAATAAVAPFVTKESLQSLLGQMRLARAAELARAGHYAEAEEVLSVGESQTNYGPAALDLLARIRAQQGRLSEADKLWVRASQIDPANSAYALALRRSAALQHGSRRATVLLSLAACVIICVLAGLWAWRRPPRDLSAEAIPAPSAQLQPAATPSTPTAPSQQPGAVSQGVQSDTAQVSPDNDIYVRGITVTKASDGLTLSFDEGLFQRGLTLKPGALARLKELGRQLKLYAADSAIQIIGMTDELPVPRRARYRDNVSLGMDRARFVYDYLRFTSGIGSSDLTIRSGGYGQVPEQNGQANNRARSRTVVLRIVRAR